MGPKRIRKEMEDAVKEKIKKRQKTLIRYEKYHLLVDFLFSYLKTISRNYFMNQLFFFTRF